jgi:AbrB family looped-hinge helix DNA binding protein
MAKRIRVDSEKLIQMVQKGTVQKEILEKFGLNTATQLKVAYADALITTGKAPAIQKSSRAAKSTQAARRVKIGKRGSIAIPKRIVEELGLKIGDTFQVRPSKAGISLKKTGSR